MTWINLQICSIPNYSINGAEELSIHLDETLLSSNSLKYKVPEIIQGLPCSPYGIRTRITTVKGWCPSP
jgi:hypothetical protein